MDDVPQARDRSNIGGWDCMGTSERSRSEFAHTEEGGDDREVIYLSLICS